MTDNVDDRDRMASRRRRTGIGSAFRAEEDDPFFARTLTRGSCRQFRPQPVEDELLDLLLDAAFCASSKSDLQQASVILVESSPQREAIADLDQKLEWILAAPRFLVFCGDCVRYEAICALYGALIDNRTPEGFLNATVDAALVMQTFVLAAEAAGLAACPISNLRYVGLQLAEILSLPDGVFPVAGLALGYALSAPEPKRRLPQELTVHRDRYLEAPLAQAIQAYDHARNDTASWSQERAGHHDPEKGEAFRAYLASTGFAFAGTPR